MYQRVEQTRDFLSRKPSEKARDFHEFVFTIYYTATAVLHTASTAIRECARCAMRSMLAIGARAFRRARQRRSVR